MVPALLALLLLALALALTGLLWLVLFRPLV